MSFKFGNMSNLIIYGAGQKGYECYQYLNKIHKKVEFIIDKDPAKVNYKYACPIISLDEIDCLNIENMVVIVCLQNGMLHDIVASELYKKGAKNIIFLPTCKKYKYEDEMRSCYRKVFEEEFDINADIPLYEEMILEDEQKYILKNDENMVTCWTSMEYIFSHELHSSMYEKYFNKHISCLKPYIILYEYIQGGDEYPYEYLKIFRGNDNIAQKKLLEDRIELWNIYEEKMNIDSSYFSSAAPIVEWNDTKKCFKIIDGHHRAAYLFFKGWYELPIRISKQAYEKYIAYHEGQEWKELEKQDRLYMYKMCVNLLQWTVENSISFDRVYEPAQTKGYVTSWLIRNDIYIEKNISSEQEIKSLYICLHDDRDFCEFIKEKKSCWIIANESIEGVYKLKKQLDLYIGFFGKERVKICLYEV